MSFIDRIDYNSSNPYPNNGLQNNENLIFYEETLEDDSYDFGLIEDMFNPRKKIKISKDHRTHSRAYTDTVTYETNTTYIYTGNTYMRYQSRYGDPRTLSTMRDELDPNNKNKQEKTVRKSFLARKDKDNFQYMLEFFEPLNKKKKKE